ncbi:MAG: thiamine phosphate synthase [Lachnospiraceae bacterium]|nr:thiamine phosphate synthase [Lachnospiraceae bacterium]
MRLKKQDMLLYAVTDRSWNKGMSIYEQVECALKGGATIVQLREKELSDELFFREAVEIKALCYSYNVPFIINDNVDIALKCGADGVHVGQDDMPVCQIRSLAGDDFIIGTTAKTVLQAVKAEKDGADYLGVGAVFPSPTKENAIRITKDTLLNICNSVKIPVAAIGGITSENMNALAGSGISGMALVSAIFAADDIESETAALKSKILQIIKAPYL